MKVGFRPELDRELEDISEEQEENARSRSSRKKEEMMEMGKQNKKMDMSRANPMDMSRAPGGIPPMPDMPNIPGMPPMPADMLMTPENMQRLRDMQPPGDSSGPVFPTTSNVPPSSNETSAPPGSSRPSNIPTYPGQPDWSRMAEEKAASDNQPPEEKQMINPPGTKK
jgi:hypothetical protein